MTPRDEREPSGDPDDDSTAGSDQRDQQNISSDSDPRDQTHRSGRPESGESAPASGEARSTSLAEDLKTVPGGLRDDARDLTRSADETLGRKFEEKPALEKAFDWRIGLAALAIALVLALLLRLVGLSPGLSALVFLVVFAIGWFALARAAAPRRPSAQADAEQSNPDN